MSISKQSQGAGNGISRAPGADGRKREIAIAAALEKQTSSASKLGKDGYNNGSKAHMGS